jgi:hypothetical protein
MWFSVTHQPTPITPMRAFLLTLELLCFSERPSDDATDHYTANEDLR